MNHREDLKNKENTFKWLECLANALKPVLSGHSKLDKTKVIKTGDSLVQAESIAECCTGAFCNTFDQH